MIYTAIITNGKISCNTAIFTDAPSVAIPKAAAMGFDAVQLTIGSAEDYDIPELKRLLAENHMKCTAMATGRVYTVDGFSMGSGDEENRKSSVERLCGLVDLGVELDGAALIIGACRGKTSDAPTPEIYHQQFEKSMREICAYASPRKVPVILELIDYLESDCCNKLPETLGYLERIGDPNLRMYLDTMHLYYEKEDMEAVLREYGSMVPQVDISGEERLCPMESVIDFRSALTALRESGFDGVLTFEIDSKKDDVKAAESLAFVRSCMEGLAE